MDISRGGINDARGGNQSFDLKQFRGAHAIMTTSPKSMSFWIFTNASGMSLFRVHDENVIRDILAVRDTCIFLGREQMRDLPQRACFSSSSTRSRCRLRFRIIPSTTHFGPTVCRTASFPGALHLRAGFEVGARVRSPRSTQSAPAGRLRKAAHRTHLDKICKNYKLCNF